MTSFPINDSPFQTPTIPTSLNSYLQLSSKALQTMSTPSPAPKIKSQQSSSQSVPILPFFPSMTKNPTKRQPTVKQLCEYIFIMRERFPECDMERVIEILYRSLVQESRKQKRAEEEGIADEYVSEEEIQEMQKKKMQQEYARKFQNSEADPRFYQQRQIAKLFCLKGYGYPTARQYLGQSITPNRYNNVITTIVRLSYRKLQYYIIKYVQPKLPMISRQQLKMIKTPLVNCRNWMTPRLSQNFHRFVKLTYKIQTPEPQRQYVLQLHQSIMNQLKTRNVTYRPHRRGGNHENANAWTTQMDQQLICNYLKYPQIAELQRHMSIVYPNNRNCFQLGRLKLRIQRLLRLSLRKMYGDRDKFGLNQPNNLSQYLVCKICRAIGALDVRKRLLSYYIQTDTNAMKLRWVKEGIEEFIKNSKNDVEEIEDSSCEIMLKEELKKEAGNENGEKKEEEEGKENSGEEIDKEGQDGIGINEQKNNNDRNELNESIKMEELHG